MRTLLYGGKLILPDRVLSGFIAVENGKIVQIGDGSPDGQFDRKVDLAGNYLSPGFVELHTHGAGGADYMDGTEASYRTACLTHLNTVPPLSCPRCWRHPRRRSARVLPPSAGSNQSWKPRA